MLKLRDVASSEGVWFPLTVRGERIELKIRPLDAELTRKIRRKHRTVKKERDPQTRQLVTVEVYDEEAIAEEMIDHVLEDFRGIGDENGNPLEPTLENKRRVIDIPPVGDEVAIAEFCFQKAAELAAEKEEGLREQEKN